VNQLQVAPGTAAPPSGGRTVGETVDDEALEMMVKLAFSLHRDLEGSDLKVQSFRKVVTLSGVATPAQRDRALQIAREAPAVADVFDQIQVRGAGTAGPGPAAGAPPMVDAPGSSTTARAACDTAGAQRSLQANPNLSGLDLRVREEGGRLLLNGAARNSTERDLAGFVAREGAGCPVQNDIEIRPAAL
jgi:osmotically-inducible protein OsmY